VSGRQLVGVVLVAVALVDLVAGFLLVLPRVRDDAARDLLRSGLVLGAVFMFALGVAFLGGWIGGSS
jgi:hypothetical protein